MFSRIMRLPLLRANFSMSQRPIKKSLQNLIDNPIQAQRKKRSAYLNIALSCFVFAACFAGIPLYRTFCEHMGLTGDNDKKQYTFQQHKVNNIKKYCVKFTGFADPSVQWDFEPVEREVNISAGQTAIVFYKLYNREDKPIVGFSTYNISPQDCNAYFSKIQCFCFNQQLVNPKEELLLPIFFYLEPEINDDISTSRINDISVSYSFLKSAKQNLAKFAEEELRKVEENKRKLNEIRAKKLNMSLTEYVLKMEKEQAERAAQTEKIKNETLRREQEILDNEIKLKKDFETEITKAQLIAQQFTNESIYGTSNKSRSQTAV